VGRSETSGPTMKKANRHRPLWRDALRMLPCSCVKK